jgi:hypothetical protein
MEFTLAAEAGTGLEGAAWRDGAGWSYRLTGADGGADRFRARVEPTTAGGREEERA